MNKYNHIIKTPEEPGSINIPNMSDKDIVNNWDKNYAERDPSQAIIKPEHIENVRDGIASEKQKII